jgi:hypothetical protein
MAMCQGFSLSWVRMVCQWLGLAVNIKEWGESRTFSKHLAFSDELNHFLAIHTMGWLNDVYDKAKEA